MILRTISLKLNWKHVVFVETFLKNYKAVEYGKILVAQIKLYYLNSHLDFPDNLADCEQ